MKIIKKRKQIKSLELAMRKVIYTHYSKAANQLGERFWSSLKCPEKAQLRKFLSKIEWEDYYE